MQKTPYCVSARVVLGRRGTISESMRQFDAGKSVCTQAERKAIPPVMAARAGGARRPLTAPCTAALVTIMTEFCTKAVRSFVVTTSCLRRESGSKCFGPPLESVGS